MPVYPAKGYSATFPVREDGECPRVGGVDENTLVAWSRLGDVLRMSSTAEFAGYDRSWTMDDFAGVLETARRLFPTAAHYDRGQFRACLRPMTPDGPPLIGPSKLRNLWFNTGQGHMGWTMGPGSGRLVADVIGRRDARDRHGGHAGALTARNDDAPAAPGADGRETGLASGSSSRHVADVDQADLAHVDGGEGVGHERVEAVLVEVRVEDGAAAGRHELTVWAPFSTCVVVAVRPGPSSSVPTTWKSVSKRRPGGDHEEADGLADLRRSGCVLYWPA